MCRNFGLNAGRNLTISQIESCNQLCRESMLQSVGTVSQAVWQRAKQGFHQHTTGFEPRIFFEVAGFQTRLYH
jgi:hypothetical protein